MTTNGQTERATSGRANDIADPFGIGAAHWPGITKLMEEAAEVIQVCSKLIATGGRTDHWSGDDLAERLIEEVGDLQAAIDYFHAHNRLIDDYRSRYGWALVEERTAKKMALFQEWDGIARRQAGGISGRSIRDDQ